MPNFHKTSTGYQGRNYAKMLNPGLAEKHTHCAFFWASGNSQISASLLDDLNALASKLGSEVHEFSAKEVRAAAQKTGWEALGPVGAQFTQTFHITYFDL
ncbi:hypothetical protein [Roseivivax sp. CAU 1761]